MPKIFQITFVLLLVVASTFNIVYAQELNQLPKYGSLQKTADQQVADAKFISSIDEFYKGNRGKAAEEIAAKGWDFLRRGDLSSAMRRFNQSWLLNNSSGTALWGMAVIQALTGKPSEAMDLFAEAESTIGEDIDFASDYAKAIGVTGVSKKNEVLIEDAFRRFASVYEKAPQHVENLQNWAITLFLVGSYAEAWKKIQLAEAAPRSAELDQKFIAALQSKMPRP